MRALVSAIFVYSDIKERILRAQVFLSSYPVRIIFSRNDVSFVATSITVKEKNAFETILLS